jgi:hypothetical protein
MKKIYSLFSLLLFLYSLTGCNQKDGDSPIPFSPEIIIIYTDTNGNALGRESSSNFEILSITNSEDDLKYWQLNPIIYSGYVCFNMTIGELFTNQSPKTERYYTVLYKVTLHSGKERKEELKLTYSKNVWGTFTKAWYNGIRMKESSTVRLFDGTKPVAGFDGTEPVAVMISDANLVYLIIPVE